MDLVNAGKKGTFWRSKHYRHVKPSTSQNGERERETYTGT